MGEMAEDAGYKERINIYNMATRPHDKELHWETHMPVRHEKTEYIICASCKRPKLLMLWWAQKDDPAKLDCHTCFMLDEAHKWPVGYKPRPIKANKTSGAGPKESNVEQGDLPSTSVVPTSVPGGKRSFSTMRRLFEQQTRGRGRPPTLRSAEEEAARQAPQREYRRIYDRKRWVTDADFRARRLATVERCNLRKLERDPMERRRQQVKLSRTYRARKMKSDPNYAMAFLEAARLRNYESYHKGTKF